jgi:hypothetical protein
LSWQDFASEPLAQAFSEPPDLQQDFLSFAQDFSLSLSPAKETVLKLNAANTNKIDYFFIFYGF